MLGGGDTMLAGSTYTGTTSGQQYGAQAIQKGGSNDLTMKLGGQTGGAYQMIVPAALVLANNVIGRGRSLRYKGKGGLSRGNSSSYSRRRKGSRRR